MMDVPIIADTVCTPSGPSKGNLEALTLSFIDGSAFAAAKSLLKGQDDLLFLIEDDSCHMG